ncbi:MAG: DHH family phosphoesterase [Patescibacteria group bacterium]
MLNLEQQIFRQWEKSKNILIVFANSQTAGGQADRADALASALALFLFFKRLNKEVELVGGGAAAAREPLSFLPGYSEIKNELHNLRRFVVSLNISQAKVSQIKYAVDQNRLDFIISPVAGWFKAEDVTTRAGEFKYDLIITLGLTDLETLGPVYDNEVEFFYKTTIINIDHHPANEEFGQINFVDLNAVATAEILFYLLKNYRPELIDEDIATSLLTGIIQETKNFKTANLTPRTLLTTSELITRGARREEIVDHLYRSRSLASLKLWGRLLNNLQSEKNGELLWSKLSVDDFQSSGAAIGDLGDVVDELIATVPSAKAIAILCEEKKNLTQLIIYSFKALNALEFIKEYAPRGTVKMAQATIETGLEEAVAATIKNLQRKLDKLTL